MSVGDRHDRVGDDVVVTAEPGAGGVGRAERAVEVSAVGLRLVPERPVVRQRVAVGIGRAGGQRDLGPLVGDLVLARAHGGRLIAAHHAVAAAIAAATAGVGGRATVVTRRTRIGRDRAIVPATPIHRHTGVVFLLARHVLEARRHHARRIAAHRQHRAHHR